MTKEQIRILNAVLSRKHCQQPIISLHVLDQDLVTTMSQIIIELAAKLDEAQIPFGGGEPQ